ncbi:MAG: T9SS type A sorting domain-containing protein [Candidatus Fermentibacteria bacterium]|nr:T9SS type A sorting domain-containing protein [Candidatus Fermentibacteria bacterium]
MKRRLVLSLCRLWFPVLLLPGLCFSWHWEQTGPQGGYFKDFAVHPQNSQIVYAGSDDSGGLWKTVNGGDSWSLLTGSWPDMTAWQITLSPSDPEIIYICDPYGRYGLLRSENGGESWAQITNGLVTQASRMVSGLVIASLDGDSLYISTGLDRFGDPPKSGDGIYSSADGGQTWIPSGLQGTTVPCLSRTGDGTLLAGVEGQGLYRSSDGVTWTQIPTIPPNGNVWQVDCMANVVVAAVNPYGTYLSLDHGVSFELSYSSFYTADLSIARVSPELEIYSCVFPGFIKYTASTGEWVDVVSSPLPDDLMIMGVTAVEDLVYCGAFANSPIFVSDNGAETWSELSSFPQSGYFSGLAVDPGNPNRIFAANLGSYHSFLNMQALSVSDDAGQTWSRTGPDAHCLFVHFSPGSSDTMYCGTFRNGAYRSDDGFGTYQSIRGGDKIVFDLAVDDDDTSVLLLSEWDIEQSTTGVYRSADGGGSFELVLPLLCSRLLHVTQSDVFFAATGQGLYMSIDQGLSWGFAGLSSYSLVSLEWHDGDLYTGAETGELFRITEASQEDISGSWSKPVNVADLLFVDSVLYAGLSGAEADTTFSLHGGVWRTFDLGNTWEDVTGDLPVDNVYGNSPMALSGSALIISTYGGGVQRLNDLQQIETREVDSGSTLTVYPNPSSSGFVLNLRDMHTGSVRVSIHDLTGRLLRQWTVEIASGSDVNCYWDCRNMTGEVVPAGVYFCSAVSSENQHRSAGMVFVR